MEMHHIKSALMRILGKKATAYIQALRFVYLLKRNKKEDPEMALLEHFLAEGDVAIDVGANGADWTWQIHQVVGSSGRIFTFEADPYYASATKLAMKLMGMQGATLFPYGLSDVEETVMLRVTDSSGHRHSGLGFIDKAADQETEGVETVTLKRLDSLAENDPDLKRVRLIKCDVEGYELPVFKGAAELLTEAKPVVILEVGQFEQQGYTAKDVFEFFEQKDYVPYVMIEGGRLAPTDDSLGHEQALSVNRIVVPKERVDEISGLLQPLGRP